MGDRLCRQAAQLGPLGADVSLVVESDSKRGNILRKHRKRLVYCLLVSLFLACVFSGPFLVVRDDVRCADAIVVIGGDHKPERMQRAAELFQQGYAPLVIISAGTIVQEGDEWMAEAEVMQRQALALDLPQEAIVLETRSLSTSENAYYTEQICQELGVDSILLVASAYHSRRARRIFRDILEPEIAVSVQPAAQDFCKLCWWLYPYQVYVVLYEYQNWVRYWFARVLG